jgi:hypothetical protein
VPVLCHCEFLQTSVRCAIAGIPVTMHPGRYPFVHLLVPPLVSVSYYLYYFMICWYKTTWDSSFHHCHDVVSLLQLPKRCWSFKLLQLTTSKAIYSFHTAHSFLSGFCCLCHLGLVIAFLLVPYIPMFEDVFATPETISASITTSVYSLNMFNVTSVASLSFYFDQYAIK